MNSYKHLIGQSVAVPMSGGRVVPVIADPYVDMAFGTGALKITPGKIGEDRKFVFVFGSDPMSVVCLLVSVVRVCVS